MTINYHKLCASAQITRNTEHLSREIAERIFHKQQTTNNEQGTLNRNRFFISLCQQKNNTLL